MTTVWYGGNCAVRGPQWGPVGIVRSGGPYVVRSSLSGLVVTGLSRGRCMVPVDTVWSGCHCSGQVVAMRSRCHCDVPVFTVWSAWSHAVSRHGAAQWIICGSVDFASGGGSVVVVLCRARHCSLPLDLISPSGRLTDFLDSLV